MASRRSHAPYYNRFSPQHHTGCVCPPLGNYMGWNYLTYPQLRCFAACSGFHNIGPAPRSPQLILNLLVVRGCVSTAGRHSLLGLHCLLIYNLTDKLQFSCYSTKKNSSRCIPAMAGVFSFKYLIRLCMVYNLNRAVYFIIFTVLPSAVRTMLMPRCSFWSFIPEAL